MIARDEGWIYVSHRLGAFVGFPPVNGKARAPPGGPTVVGAWVREQAPRLGVCCLVRGGGAEPTEGQGEIRGVLMHRPEQVADEVEIAVIIAGDSELLPHAGKPMLLIARQKRGISGHEDSDLDLVRDLLQAMHENAADFTLTFRRLCAAAADETADAEARGLFANPGAYDGWAARWRSRLAVDGREPKARAEAMRAVNPAFIPRNHRVEQALNAAIEDGDFSPFAELL